MYRCWYVRIIGFHEDNKCRKTVTVIGSEMNGLRNRRVNEENCDGDDKIVWFWRDDIKDKKMVITTISAKASASSSLNFKTMMKMEFWLSVLKEKDRISEQEINNNYKQAFVGGECQQQQP